ncbi:MAG TPA: nucleotidyltransferase domain-containing protein [Acidilobales archaeon]|nr:MAG: DNA polymerase III subunit beta [Desulfurococcales archaeon ex4484_42]HDD26896.1 nucleotidyltransferase domain-containing protein [Acidilobales archaeon]
MSERLLVEEAERRAKIFRNLWSYLKLIAKIVKELDRDAEVYLFGSVAEGRYLLSSDIDVLVVTVRKPEEVISRLWEVGIGDPFEIHVITKEYLEIYKRRSKLVQVT